VERTGNSIARKKPTLASTWQVAGGNHLIALARSGVMCGLIYLIYFVSSGLAKVGVASSSLVSRSISRFDTHERRIVSHRADGRRVRTSVTLQNSRDISNHIVRARDQQSTGGLRIAQQRLMRALELRR